VTVDYGDSAPAPQPSFLGAGLWRAASQVQSQPYSLETIRDTYYIAS